MVLQIILQQNFGIYKVMLQQFVFSAEKTFSKHWLETAIKENLWQQF